MSELPHFAFPFQLQGSSFAVLEQDTVEEVAQCVEVLIATPVGARTDQPDFGVVDLTFQQSIDHAAILDAVAVWEPRALAEVASSPDDLDELVQRVQIMVKAGGSD